MKIEAIAEYITDGDTVLAEIYVIDEVEQVYHPELVKAGEVDLLFLSTPITKTIKFDRRMGNADGSFKFAFSHPPRIKNIQFQVRVTLMDDSSYTKTVGLLIDTEDSYPFAENADAGTDHRTRLRQKEEV